jgi:hypothetical protein
VYHPELALAREKDRLATVNTGRLSLLESNELIVGKLVETVIVEPSCFKEGTFVGIRPPLRLCIQEERASQTRRNEPE